METNQAVQDEPVSERTVLVHELDQRVQPEVAQALFYMPEPVQAVQSEADQAHQPEPVQAVQSQVVQISRDYRTIDYAFLEESGVDELRPVLRDTVLRLCWMLGQYQKCATVDPEAANPVSDGYVESRQNVARTVSNTLRVIKGCPGYDQIPSGVAGIVEDAGLIDQNYFGSVPVKAGTKPKRDDIHPYDMAVLVELVSPDTPKSDFDILRGNQNGIR